MATRGLAPAASPSIEWVKVVEFTDAGPIVSFYPVGGAK